MKRRELMWKNLWLAVRRSGKDERAQKVLLASGSVALVWVGYGLYVVRAYRETGPWGVAFEVGMLALGCGVALMIRRRYKKEDESVFRLSGPVVAAPAEYGRHRVKLAGALLRTAAMVDRATAEAVHVAGQMPVEVVGGLRRRSLEMARRTGVWEGFGEAERSLLMDDEGSWRQETTFAWLGRLEDVRVLRWVLGMDEVLVPFEFVTADMRPVLATFEQADEVMKGSACLPPWDLRPAQSVANLMLNRCVAEGVRRGFFEVEDEETRRECLAVADGMHASPGEDLFIGVKTVARATDEEVQRMGRVALRRDAVLTEVIGFLNGPADADLLVPLCE